MSPSVLSTSTEWVDRVLLEGQISINRSKGLALWRPVGEKLNDPRHTSVSVQLVLDTQAVLIYD